ncbi:MAG: hypothetical protein JWM10_2028 [Myxococcaceae bacterium]|nr:hypothetical protein [Myxococcaceae bacterium]
MTMRWALAIGMMALAGCGTATNNAGTSGDPDSGVATGSNACNEACAAQARANCSAFQMGDCVSTCQAAATSIPQCSAQFSAATNCYGTATYTCSSTSNRPTTTSCQAESVAAVQCATADAGP